jgi:folate-binding protein YgfZ
MDVEAEARALVEGAGMRRLTEQRVLSVRGEDAASWLQGQVSNDVAAIGPGGSGYGLVLETSGKILSDLFVHRAEDGFLLVVPEELSAGVLAHLDAHVIMEDVELALCPDRIVLSVQGPGAAEVERRARAAAGQGAAFAADRLGAGGVDLVAPAARAGELEAALLAAGATPVGGLGWELARVRAAVPRVGQDFGAFTLPQEAGLSGRAVSFTKGCYLGQEPVVMLEHRGKPPKRLFVARGEGPLAAGAELVTGEGERAGRVTSAAALPDADGGTPALALVKRAHASSGATLRCGEVTVRLVHPVGERASSS